MRARARQSHCAHTGQRQIRCPVATGGRPGVEQSQQRRHDGLRLGAVGDVLAGEGGLMHLGPHVARVEGVDRTRWAPRRPARPTADRARPSTTRTRPSPDTAPPPRRSVRLTITPALPVSAGSDSLDQGKRREHVRRRTPPAVRSPGSRPGPVAGWGRAGWRCSPAGEAVPRRLRRRPVRRDVTASVTSPGSAISRAELSSRAVVSSSAARRASPTTVQPRSRSAAVSARPNPRDAPVTMATGVVSE